MSGKGHCFVEWKQEFVLQERGNRAVHYFLKGSNGESIRAVIGTERSVRDMFYIVAEEFVKVYGAEHSIHAGFKWRSRREVVHWLTSMLSKQHLEGDRSKSPKHDALLALQSPECAMIEISAQKALAQNDLGHFSRNLNGQSSDIVWSGSAWTCGKHLKHFLAFCRSGTAIALAMPDKLGMRYSGRQTVPPVPPSTQEELALEVGVAVDAWWNDSWWEGVITGVNSIGDDGVQVYLHGENLFVNIHKNDLRSSRDWDGDRWIDIKARPDIPSLISDAISPDMDTKVSMSTTPVVDAKLDGCTIPVEAVPAKTIAEGEKPELACRDCSDNLEEETGGKELASLKDEKDRDTSDSKKPPPSDN